MPYRIRPQHDVVIFAARKVLQPRSKTFSGECANIHLQAFKTENHTRLVRPRAKHFLSFGMTYQVTKGASRPWTSDKNVQVADRLTPTAQAPCGLNLFYAAERSEFRH